MEWVAGFFEHPNPVALVGLVLILATYLTLKLTARVSSERRRHTETLVALTKDCTTAIVGVHSAVEGVKEVVANNNRVTADNTKATEEMRETFNELHKEILRGVGRGSGYATRGG